MDPKVIEESLASANRKAAELAKKLATYDREQLIAIRDNQGLDEIGKAMLEAVLATKVQRQTKSKDKGKKQAA